MLTNDYWYSNNSACKSVRYSFGFSIMYINTYVIKMLLSVPDKPIICAENCESFKLLRLFHKLLMPHYETITYTSALAADIITNTDSRHHNSVSYLLCINYESFLTLLHQFS